MSNNIEMKNLNEQINQTEAVVAKKHIKYYEYDRIKKLALEDLEKIFRANCEVIMNYNLSL